jgi:hypothetical protein
MTRPSRSRVTMTAALALGAGVVGLTLAPSALAAGLAAPTAPSSVVAGTPFTVSGTGCVNIPGHVPGADDKYRPDVYVATDLTQSDDGIVIAGTDANGSWSARASFPAGTTGQHTVHVACANGYHEDPVAYPDVTVTVTAPASTEWKPGATPNTPGIANTTTSATTGSTAVPGTKVIKVLKGFKPHEVVTLVLHSTPITLGTFTADAQGVLTVSFTLPAGTPLGAHTLAYDGNMGSHFEDPIKLGAASASLAYTGADIALPLGLGCALVVAGAGTLVVTRRRKTGAQQA